MATLFYMPATAEATPFNPTPDAAWEDTSILARAVLRTTKIADALTTVTFADSDSTDKDILFRQYVSELPLTPGQTITGGQAIAAVCRVLEVSTFNNMFFTVAVRIVNLDGTVQKTLLAPTRDDTEASTSLLGRYLSATSAAGNYTTVTNDHLVIELGMGGDPAGASGGDHDSSMRLGDSAASDLAFADGSSSDDNPVLQLADTLTFTVVASDIPPGLGPSVGMGEPLQSQGSGALLRY